MGDYEEQAAAYRAAEARHLSGFVQRCVDSGGVLSRSGNAGPARLSCAMCDCFGYSIGADGRAHQPPAVPVGHPENGDKTA